MLPIRCVTWSLVRYEVRGPKIELGHTFAYFHLYGSKVARCYTTRNGLAQTHIFRYDFDIETMSKNWWRQKSRQFKRLRKIDESSLRLRSSNDRAPISKTECTFSEPQSSFPGLGALVSVKSQANDVHQHFWSNWKVLEVYQVINTRVW